MDLQKEAGDIAAPFKELAETALGIIAIFGPLIFLYGPPDRDWWWSFRKHAGGE